MLFSTLLSLAVSATFILPTLGAVGDKYDVVGPGGKKFARLTVTQYHKGTVRYTTEQIDTIVEHMDDSLDENYDKEGEAEFQGTVSINDDHQVESSVDTSGSHSSLKEIFTQDQWEKVVDKFWGSVLGGNEEDGKSPQTLACAIQGINTAGHVVGPCKDDESDCIIILEYGKKP